MTIDTSWVDKPPVSNADCRRESPHGLQIQVISMYSNDFRATKEMLKPWKAWLGFHVEEFKYQRLGRD